MVILREIELIYFRGDHTIENLLLSFSRENKSINQICKRSLQTWNYNRFALCDTKEVPTLASDGPPEQTRGHVQLECELPVRAASRIRSLFTLRIRARHVLCIENRIGLRIHEFVEQSRFRPAGTLAADLQGGPEFGNYTREQVDFP